MRCLHELYEGYGIRGVINRVKLRDVIRKLLHCPAFLASTKLLERAYTLM